MRTMILCLHSCCIVLSYSSSLIYNAMKTLSCVMTQGFLKKCIFNTHLYICIYNLCFAHCSVTFMYSIHCIFEAWLKPILLMIHPIAWYIFKVWQIYCSICLYKLRMVLSCWLYFSGVLVKFKHWSIAEYPSGVIIKLCL